MSWRLPTSRIPQYLEMSHFFCLHRNMDQMTVNTATCYNRNHTLSVGFLEIQFLVTHCVTPMATNSSPHRRHVGCGISTNSYATTIYLFARWRRTRVCYLLHKPNLRVRTARKAYMEKYVMDILLSTIPNKSSDFACSRYCMLEVEIVIFFIGITLCDFVCIQ